MLHQTQDHPELNFAIIIHLPPCARCIYYLQWNGNCIKDIPDFILFNNGTPQQKILQSFTFKQAPVNSTTKVTFVQIVCGPYTNVRKIRKSLSLLHIKVNVLEEERLTDINSNFFAIPFFEKC